MQVCTMAMARATIGGPGLVSRIACRHILLHCNTTLPVIPKEDRAGGTVPLLLPTGTVLVPGEQPVTISNTVPPPASTAPTPRPPRNSFRRLRTVFPLGDANLSPSYCSSIAFLPALSHRTVLLIRRIMEQLPN